MSETIDDTSSLWPIRHIVHRGGLFGVGLAAGFNLLLVVSHAGRGVSIACLGMLSLVIATNSFRSMSAAVKRLGSARLRGRNYYSWRNFRRCHGLRIGGWVDNPNGELMGGQALIKCWIAQ